MSERLKNLKQRSKNILAQVAFALILLTPGGEIHAKNPPPVEPVAGPVWVTDTDSVAPSVDSSSTINSTVYLPIIAKECTPGILGPSDVLDLRNQKLTLPVDKDGNSIADEVLQPELCTFIDPERFVAGTDEHGNYVRMAIEKDDEATTDGSDYPRTEFREMKENGQVPAGWESGVGRHTITSRISVVEFAQDIDGKLIDTSLLQIHGIGPVDIQIRAKREEGKINIVVHYDGANGQKVNHPFILDYQAGTLFNAGFRVENNIITAIVNGVEHQITANPDDRYYAKLGPYRNGKADQGTTAMNVYQYNIQHTPSSAVDLLGKDSNIILNTNIPGTILTWTHRN